MTIDERNIKLASFFEECKEILKSKGADYNPDNVAFSEIRNVSKVAGIRPEQAMLVLMNKHWGAIASYAGKGKVESEPIKERLHDLANYAALMSVMIEEGK